MNELPKPELPPLPAPKAEAWGNSQDSRFDAYTAEQMRSYGELCWNACLLAVASAIRKTQTEGERE